MQKTAPLHSFGPPSKSHTPPSFIKQHITALSHHLKPSAHKNKIKCVMFAFLSSCQVICTILKWGILPYQPNSLLFRFNTKFRFKQVVLENIDLVCVTKPFLQTVLALLKAAVFGLPSILAHVARHVQKHRILGPPKFIWPMDLGNQGLTIGKLREFWSSATMTPFS